MTYATYVVVNGLVFPETPRWHLGQFWFTDQFTGRVMRLSLEGTLETIATLPDHIGGLGWLPDGTLLTVGMTGAPLVPPGRRRLRALRRPLRPGRLPLQRPAGGCGRRGLCGQLRVRPPRAGPRRSPPS